jgi:dihydrofolate synthase / folylpolyglutamate synthase
MSWTYEEARAGLDAHVNLEAIAKGETATPTLDRMRRLVEVMADPQHQYPVLHLTGTNGKTSTARILARLLEAMGLTVGSYTSPHLERINERMQRNGEPISDGAFAEVVGAILDIEPVLDVRLTHFEILTGAAFRWFADIAVDAAVVEVGMGGKWDTTNVADGQVAVVTNVGIDHVEYLGPTREGIAEEKAGIIKPGSTLVLGETDEALAPIFTEAGAAQVWVRETDFGCLQNRVAHGGRLLDLRTPGATYEDVYLSLHGPHQGDNAACALAAAEAFFGFPLPDDVVAEALADVASPGRLEVTRRQPLCVLDGAHNPHGMTALAAALADDFATVERRIVVLGCMRTHDPTELLTALGTDSIAHVVACSPDWPRALEADAVAQAARDLGLDTSVVAGVPEAVATALAMAGRQDMVLVTGSLYVVGAARAALRAGVG